MVEDLPLGQILGNLSTPHHGIAKVFLQVLAIDLHALLRAVDLGIFSYSRALLTQSPFVLKDAIIDILYWLDLVLSLGIWGHVSGHLFLLFLFFFTFINNLS